MFYILDNDVLIEIMSHLDYESLKIMSESSNIIRKIYNSKQFAKILKSKYDIYKYTYQFTGIDRCGEFFIIDKFSKLIPFKYTLNNERLCTWYSKHQLIDIMWEIGPSIGISLDDNDEIINVLLNKRIKGHTYCEMLQWNLDKLNHYYRWYNIDEFNRESLCALIHSRMNELGSLKYV